MVRTKKTNVNSCKYLSHIRTFSFGFTTGDVLWIIFPKEKISMYVIRLMPKEKDEREREREKGRDCVLRGGVDV